MQQQQTLIVQAVCYISLLQLGSENLKSDRVLKFNFSIKTS